MLVAQPLGVMLDEGGELARWVWSPCLLGAFSLLMAMRKSPVRWLLASIFL